MGGKKKKIATKAAKSAEKKMLKAKLHIETKGRRGKAKFGELVTINHEEEKLFQAPLGADVINEDSNYGLLDPSLTLSDYTDILQSPRKLGGMFSDIAART